MVVYLFFRAILFSITFFADDINLHNVQTKFSGANGDREILIFPVQLTTSRIGNLTRLILTLAVCEEHTYIHVLGEKL